MHSKEGLQEMDVLEAGSTMAERCTPAVEGVGSRPGLDEETEVGREWEEKQGKVGRIQVCGSQTSQPQPHPHHLLLL